MCLMPRTGRQTASQDIVVYKVLLKRENQLIAPFHYFEYGINETVFKTNFTETEYGEIEEGFHSVLSIGSALWYQHLLQSDHWNREYVNGEYVICKAIIPKGTVYIKGCAEDIVSLALKITEICH